MALCIRFMVLGFLTLGAIERMERVDSADWSYLKNDRVAAGPERWNDEYALCSGEMQSPIGINTHDLKYDPELKAIHMVGYDVYTTGEWRFENNGHTVLVHLPSGITIEGAGLDGKFEAAQFHFHWGSSNDHGSEHVVDGHRYPMEVGATCINNHYVCQLEKLHIVHYNTKYGASLTAAADKFQGLAVIGVFFEVGDFNPWFEAITNKLPKVHHKGDKVSMRPIQLRQLLPRGLHNYFRYDGSLTTPPCYESVEWTVFEETVKISQEQLDDFRNVQFDNDPKHLDPMVDNFRNPMPIGRRTVFTSEAEDDPNGWDDDFHEDWGLIAAVALLFFLIGRFSTSPKVMEAIKNKSN